MQIDFIKLAKFSVDQQIDKKEGFTNITHDKNNHLTLFQL